MAQVFNPSTLEADRDRQIFEFQATRVNIVSFRKAKASQKDSVS